MPARTAVTRSVPQGEPWTAAMKGHDARMNLVEDDRKRLLLERFQREVRASALEKPPPQARERARACADSPICMQPP
jgi:hypothetical protein